MEQIDIYQSLANIINFMDKNKIMFKGQTNPLCLVLKKISCLVYDLNQFVALKHGKPFDANLTDLMQTIFNLRCHRLSESALEYIFSG